MAKLKGYLAGAIRDENPHDFKWRKKAHEKLNDVATIYNPMHGKTYDEKERKWSVFEEDVTAQFITSADFWAIDHCEFAIFNFLALQDNYPMLGTTSEWGRSTARSILRFVVWPTGFNGHQHAQFQEIHPFINMFATKVFNEVNPCLAFVRSYLIALGSR